MIRGKLNRGERPDGRSIKDLVFARQQGLPLVCRNCREVVSKRTALKVGGGSLRCPKCGGVLDRESSNGRS